MSSDQLVAPTGSNSLVTWLSHFNEKYPYFE